jgi:hypothetical protein
MLNFNKNRETLQIAENKKTTQEFSISKYIISKKKIEKRTNSSEKFIKNWFYFCDF